VNGLIVVGAGAMGWNHARVCSELGILAAVVDQDHTTLKAISEKFRVPTYLDLNQAIVDLEPTGAIISTPTKTHYNLGVSMIKLGLNVLIEKPISDTIEKGEKLVKIAREKGVVLSVGHIERYNPVIPIAKEKIMNGDWGDIVTITSTRVSNFPGRIRDVGVILDLGIHDIDNCIFLMGSNPKKVYAHAGRINDIEYEDHATISIEFENGKQATIEVNWITPMKVRSLSLTCEKAFVSLDYINQEIDVSSSVFKDPGNPNLFPQRIEFQTKTIDLIKDEPLRLEIVDFVNAIKNGHKTSVTGEQGLLALKVALAALKSIESGVVIDV
tara:strand:+ start:7264 stop:8244 length:981 start_codon:yes stop_codon:yes gene_type:complete